MGTKRINEFEKLRNNTGCSQYFACAGSLFRDACGINNEFDIDSLECLECGTEHCEFIRISELKSYCNCPLRNYIARNFKNFIFDSADRIERKN